MTVLFGHPGGNPNSFNAALAHFEAGNLEAFCVPWMPTTHSLQLLRSLPRLAPMANRLSRRQFTPLADASVVQGRVGEWYRLAMRALGKGDERLSYQANDWLMRTMARECSRPAVTAVHSFEDCSLWQFEAAKRLGKACIYDMPIGYYPAWEATQNMLATRYANWLPANGLAANRYVRPEQKRMEMDLADLVLVPSEFVAGTVRDFHPNKIVKVAPYGVDTAAWLPSTNKQATETLTFLFAGQCSVRKGIPLLLEAWRLAKLKNAKLSLVGAWQFNDSMRNQLAPQVSWLPPQPRDILQMHYQDASVFILPSYFEGRALVVGEAMASGLPVLTTMASGAADLINEQTGRLIPTGDLDALVAALRWFSDHRGDLPAMGLAAREAAERCTWSHYRQCVNDAVAPFI